MSLSLNASVAAEQADADEVSTFEARPGKQWRLALLCLGIGLVGLLPLIAIAEWARGGPAPNGNTVVSALCALLIPLGIALAVNAVRGWPRLTLTGHGIRLDTSLGSRWADWDSLNAFEIKTTYTGRFRKETQSGVAAIVGVNTSKSWRSKKQFLIPDHFVIPIADIVKRLNAGRAAALGMAGGALAPVAPAEPAVGLIDFKIPWLTLALLVVLVLVFAVEMLVAKTSGAMPLIVAAGVSRATVLHGEWYRLFTAPLLHASFAHILGNGIALLLGGIVLERLVGRLWLFALFVVGGFGGSLMSIALNGPNLTSVGASGALMTLFAALFTLSFHLPEGTASRQRLQFTSLRILIPSLLPFLSAAGGRIDYAGHLGGALIGAMLGLVLLRNWPETHRIPQLRHMALGLTVLGGALMLVSAGMAVANFSTYNVVMIPVAEVPRTSSQIQERSSELARRYPDDPRIHFYLGITMANKQDNANAERELGVALTKAMAAPGLFQNVRGYEMSIRIVLAELLAREGKRDDATRVAQPICVSTGIDGSFVKILADQKLCE